MKMEFLQARAHYPSPTQSPAIAVEVEVLSDSDGILVEDSHVGCHDVDPAVSMVDGSPTEEGHDLVARIIDGRLDSTDEAVIEMGVPSKVSEWGADQVDRLIMDSLLLLRADYPVSQHCSHCSRAWAADVLVGARERSASHS